MKTRFIVILAMLLGLFVTALPGMASAQAERTGDQVNVTAAETMGQPSRLLFETAVYNGTGRWMQVSRVDQCCNPGSDWSWLAPGKWSDEYTNIGDVNQLQVPGCSVFVQGRWYSAGTWAKVYFVPYLWVVNLGC